MAENGYFCAGCEAKGLCVDRARPENFVLEIKEKSQGGYEVPKEASVHFVDDDNFSSAPCQVSIESVLTETKNGGSAYRLDAHKLLDVQSVASKVGERLAKRIDRCRSAGYNGFCAAVNRLVVQEFFEEAVGYSLTRKNESVQNENSQP